MDKITISNVDDTVWRQLRQIASEEGIPPEETLRRLITQAAREHGLRRLDAMFPVPTD
jgi:hypothetical protein